MAEARATGPFAEDPSSPERARGPTKNGIQPLMKSLLLVIRHQWCIVHAGGGLLGYSRQRVRNSKLRLLLETWSILYSGGREGYEKDRSERLGFDFTPTVQGAHIIAPVSLKDRRGGLLFTSYRQDWESGAKFGNTNDGSVDRIADSPICQGQEWNAPLHRHAFVWAVCLGYSKFKILLCNASSRAANQANADPLTPPACLPCSLPPCHDPRKPCLWMDYENNRNPLAEAAVFVSRCIHRRGMIRDLVSVNSVTGPDLDLGGPGCSVCKRPAARRRLRYRPILILMSEPVKHASPQETCTVQTYTSQRGF
ncbi:hypothetical protein B0T26DRAFT_674790 [Lasiosphaeria miniovina]|uniref:Uncharacterized protein n=1 Tax=Lasiosphaeria miniovina TaxID=1954250 RepID=A0AA40AW91_9PEZI|nr:uncharacterized protein B0T26DRAFT_674790 [Lasiosphaeria miniovina]KAK0723182.1 hypothetical protein B0T26DRAFT_674790 [Lasiosphaeria miniovina]